MTDNQLIRQALLDAALADYGTAGLLEAPSFSTKYLAWEKKFLRKTSFMVNGPIMMP